jgi:small nuclear ribonucleoprotein (snRNP)-like protein
MSNDPSSRLLQAMIGRRVVLDLSSPYVCLGTLREIDPEFLALGDADLHDFRDSPVTREVYVYDSVRLGIRRNRRTVIVRRDEIVAITPFEDVLES